MCPTSGGTLLALRGTAFIVPVSVFIEGNECPMVSASSTLLYCSLPVGAGFDASVIVFAQGLFSVAQPLLSYAQPRIESITGCARQVNPLAVADCERNGSSVVTLTGRH